MDYNYQLYSTASPGCKIYKLDRIDREDIRIYAGAFRMSPVESLQAEACNPTMELRRNKLGLRFLYKIRSNFTYTIFLNTLDDREDQNYVGNKGATNQQDYT